MISSLTMMFTTLMAKNSVQAEEAEADTASQVPQSEKEASVLPTSNLSNNLSNNLAASKGERTCEEDF